MADNKASDATTAAASATTNDASKSEVVTPTDASSSTTPSAASSSSSSSSSTTPANPDDLLSALYGLRPRIGHSSTETSNYKFWSTQPVPKLEDNPTEHGPIEIKTIDDVQKEPYALPSAFEWSDCDMTNESVVEEVYKLLTENYVEDDDNMFRFDYSRDFLKWALLPPGYKPQWHIGVRMKTNKKLFAFITGIPAEIRSYSNKIPMVEINFLCVHKKLRSKRLAPVLIKEVTRRVNLCNIWQAVYTAGVVLPKPIARNRYYHRSLNPKKLIEIGFSRLGPHMTMARTIKLYKLPDKNITPGLRVLEARDVKETQKLVQNYLSKFNLVPHYSYEEFAHWFLPRDNVIYSWVVEDPDNGKITDFISFYCLPSSVMGNDKYNNLRAAYSFYNVSTKTSWNDLITDALICARDLNFDVYNSLNVMENDAFLKQLKFGIGDGQLQYYLYNWKAPEMTPNQVGLVLL